MAPAIVIENLSKRYRVNHEANPARYRTLRDSLVNLVRRPFRRSDGAPAEEFWALKGVNLEVQPGEVLGIIGHNGAGKSTLLKILSRITKPTVGRVVLHGRVGTLLEVGTGFHPELTGRENIFLNGSILGMSRREIQHRFDEIVAFAEIERFLDLPVKRYSSGMYVRLAFAVAAHLEPEIMLVDEVLAVGDTAFQNRCLKKMGDFCQSGRTILFVSHNLSSIRTLCRQALVMRSGRIISQGSADAQVAAYLAALVQAAGEPLAERHDREGHGLVRLVELRFLDGHGHTVETVLAGSELSVVIGYRLEPGARLDMANLSFWSMDGTKVFHVDTMQRGLRLQSSGRCGEIVCRFPRFPLVPGSYRINSGLFANGAVGDHLFAAGSLTVLPGDFFGTGKPAEPEGGLLFLDPEWHQPTELPRASKYQST